MTIAQVAERAATDSHTEHNPANWRTNGTAIWSRAEVLWALSLIWINGVPQPFMWR